MDLAEIDAALLSVRHRLLEAKADDALAAVCVYEKRIEALLDRKLETR